MIKNLSYSVTFPITGRTLNGSFSFDKGSTAITGPNESGKSFCIEMIRFSFFGTQALRGKVDDYKGLKSSMEFTIKGANYVVERTLSNAKLLREGEPIAVGTRPVNQKILAILGFDLGVFDVACNTNQSEVTRLGDMAPTERKRMVDQTIGLDRMDTISKWASEQRLLLSREVDVLERGLVEPTEPVRPDDYAPSTELRTTVDQLRGQKAEFDQLVGWLAHERKEPVCPEKPVVTATEEELAAIDAAAAEIRHIGSLPVVDFDPEEVRAQWAAVDKWDDRLRFERRHPRPTMTQEQIDAERARAALLKELQDLEAQHARLSKSPTATCPECHHVFSLEHEKLASVMARIADIGAIDRAPINTVGLDQEEQRVKDWSSEDTLKWWEEIKDVPKAEPPSVSRAALAGAVNGITTAERDRRLAAVPNFRARNIVVGELSSLREFAIHSARYEQELSTFREWSVIRDEKRARAEELAPVLEALPEAERRLVEAQAYEQALSIYQTQKASYDERVVEVASKKAEVEGWKQVGALLVDLRTKVKTYLVPSLSKVASHLLAQMTGGQRSSIVVNEDFEITVDNQRLETLSGSGKACANLALRIGLGQVLTNNVLSLFIGDEIDASMDEDRATFTQDSLVCLAGSISQIILVTHKVPSADKVVRLGG